MASSNSFTQSVASNSFDTVMELANRAMDDRNFVIKALDALDLLAVSASDTTNETINKRWSLLKCNGFILL